MSVFAMHSRNRRIITPEIIVKHQAGLGNLDRNVLVDERALDLLIDGEEPPDPTQIPAIVNKLQSVIANYMRGLAGGEFQINAEDILQATNQALAESDGTPWPYPEGENAHAFIVHGLYEEIVQQPSNIFETRIFPDGSERYIPIGKGMWKACLHALRKKIHLIIDT